MNSNGGQVTRMVVIGVDPDSHGAVAVASWDTTDISQQVELSQVQVRAMLLGRRADTHSTWC